MQKNAFVRPSGPVEKDPIGAGQGTTRQVLISAADAPNFALRKFIMEPGGGMPKHTNTVEHEQYILKGKAKVGIGDEVHDVSEGDAVYIPKGVPHWYEADSSLGFEFLCIVPNEPDSITLCGD